MKKEYPICVAGEWKKTASPLDVINPYDGSVAGVTFLAGADDIERAVEAGAAAFEELKKYPSCKRADILSRVVKGIMERADELARTIAIEAGKPIKDARAEVKRAANTFQIASEEAKRLGGEVLPLDVMEGPEKRVGIVRRFPVGPVLAITPFNFPLNLVAHKVAPAMACGCPVIVKPATKTPLAALTLGKIITGAGWPPGGISVVPCPSALAEKAVKDRRIKKLTFTGSAAVGWRLKDTAGMKRVTLELGGNAGVIIEEDADIDLAAKRCAYGAFSYAGQVCISVQRIYAHRNVFERFTARFLENVRALRPGDPLDQTTDIGPMIDEAAAERAEAWVKEAVKEGAKVLVGGKRQGNFFEPTVLTGVRPSMKVCNEEVFAPVATLSVFEDFEQAVAEVNNSPYGLQAGIFTNDAKKIFYAFEKLDVGGVIAGDVPTYRADNMPYGGVKMSGFGREGVRYAIEEMTEQRVLVLNL
ncbi:MAG: aldehyde dehydrogenase family protein [Deltaproteobacteria bacterium]|nr:aldehyde dehydrogenase family protein [Deltaproteobacteria bacterium]